jgi:putative endonuclease
MGLAARTGCLFSGGYGRRRRDSRAKNRFEGRLVNNKEKGAAAEEAAAEYLSARGCRVLTRNYRTALGEIDLIAEQEDLLIFVEVRSRREISRGLPQETVNRAKQQKIRRVATQYLKHHQAMERFCRFDVVGILLGRQNQVESVEWIQDAF